MAEITEWGGHTWRRWPNAKQRSDRVYFQRSITGGVLYLHREVWKSFHGDIPKGHHIHHIDENPGNNSIENLECLSAKDHAANHPLSAERLELQSRHLAKINHLARAWHSTPEGIEEHRRIGAMAYANFVPQEKNCENCNKPFMPKAIGNRDRFCSNACKSDFRRKSGVDDEVRTCQWCDGQFTVSKYSKARTCCRSCANSEMHRNRKKGI